MADTDTCPHCDVLLEWHNHEHLARHCYPKQLEAARARIAELEQQQLAVRSTIGGTEARLQDENADLRRQLEEAHAVLRDNANYMAIHGMLSQAWTDCLAATRRVEDSHE